MKRLIKLFIVCVIIILYNMCCWANVSNHRDSIIEHDIDIGIKTERAAILNWCSMYASKKVTDDELKKIVDDVIKRDNYILLLSIISVESAFYKKAISPKNARGLMQVRPSIWLSELRENFPHIQKTSDLHKIKNNIDAGEYIITQYLKSTGNVKDALNKYVGGDRLYVAQVLMKYYELCLHIEYATDGDGFRLHPVTQEAKDNDSISENPASDAIINNEISKNMEDPPDSSSWKVITLIKCEINHYNKDLVDCTTYNGITSKKK